MSFKPQDDKAYLMPITFGLNTIIYPASGKKYNEPGEIHVASKIGRASCRERV